MVKSNVSSKDFLDEFVSQQNWMPIAENTRNFLS